MVASWYIFKPKILIWLNFGGFSMEEVGLFDGPLVYFTDTWYNLVDYLVYFTPFVKYYQLNST
jgi:hypothetical protein